MTDLRDPWAKVEAALRTLLADLPTLTDEERTQVQHYIDHNEFGLALEDLCFAIKVKGAAITPSRYEAILSLQTMMKMRAMAETVGHLVHP
jgi:hypothetical protein